MPRHTFPSISAPRPLAPRQATTHADRRIGRSGSRWSPHRTAAFCVRLDYVCWVSAFRGPPPALPSGRRSQERVQAQRTSGTSSVGHTDTRCAPNTGYPLARPGCEQALDRYGQFASARLGATDGGLPNSGLAKHRRRDRRASGKTHCGRLRKLTDWRKGIGTGRKRPAESSARSRGHPPRLACLGLHNHRRVGKRDGRMSGDATDLLHQDSSERSGARGTCARCQ